MDLSAIIHTEQHVLVTLEPKTARGNRSDLDGQVSATLLSGQGTFEIVDQLHIKLFPPPVVDGVDSVWEIRGDADLGPDNNFLIDMVTITTTNAPATTLGTTLTTVDNP